MPPVIYMPLFELPRSQDSRAEQQLFWSWAHADQLESYSQKWRVLRSFPPPLKIGHCFRVSPLPATAFCKTHRNLIMFESYTPFQIWLRLASKMKIFLQVDRQCDYKQLLSLGNQANRNNSDKHTRCINNTVQCWVSVKCEAAVTVESSNGEKKHERTNISSSVPLHRQSRLKNYLQVITLRTILISFTLNVESDLL